VPEAVAPVTPDTGAELVALMRDLYPLPRSLTGDGVRATLRRLDEILPLEVSEVATGTPVFDWTVPKEWNIAAAWIADASGRRLVDFQESNLHVLGYSVPVRTRMRGAELQERLHSLPEHPDWIPARTAYWAETWGFCVTQRQRDAFEPDAEYEVCIDSRLEDGHLTYAEALVPGRLEQEVLLSTYVCHPSLCNDNLSGIAVLALAGRALAERDLRYSYRLLFSPGTVGPLSWLSRNQERLERIRHGVVVSCVGDPGVLRYKRSRRGAAEIDRVAAHVLSSKPGALVEDFVPWGGDERQFGSPGFDLPVGALTRTPHGLYPEYHTSADDFTLVTAESLADSLATLLEIVDVLERNVVYRSTSPFGEPQLGRRGLYREISAGVPRAEETAQRALMWVLNLADGAHSLLDIAERSELPFDLVAEAAQKLRDADLLEEVAA
jgi:aminopeptidase-like protein